MSRIEHRFTSRSMHCVPAGSRPAALQPHVIARPSPANVVRQRTVPHHGGIRRVEPGRRLPKRCSDIRFLDPGVDGDMMSATRMETVGFLYTMR